MDELRSKAGMKDCSRTNSLTPEALRRSRAPFGASKAAATTLAAFTFVLWGLLPVYWKCFSQVPAYEVLAHRIWWSFVFMAALVLVTGRRKELAGQVRELLAHKRKLAGMALAAILLSCNWLTYIWAVNHDRVVESSLGYYILPLLNVLIGVTVLRERLSLWQFLAVLLAAAGVLYLTVGYGSFPAVSLILAGTMAIYGLAKKVTGLAAVVGMTLETALIAPLALIFLIGLYSRGGGYPIGPSPTFLLLVGAGVVTSVPLIIFAFTLNRLSLTVMGLVQYISPTLTLLLGVLAYGEPFTRVHLISFSLIWGGLILFTISRTPPLARLERRLSQSWGGLGRRP